MPKTNFGLLQDGASLFGVAYIERHRVSRGCPDSRMASQDGTRSSRVARTLGYACPRWAQDGPRWLHDDPRGAQLRFVIRADQACPGQLAQGGFKMASGCHRGVSLDQGSMSCVSRKVPGLLETSRAYPPYWPRCVSIQRDHCQILRPVPWDLLGGWCGAHGCKHIGSAHPRMPGGARWVC